MAGEGWFNIRNACDRITEENRDERQITGNNGELFSVPPAKKNSNPSAPSSPADPLPVCSSPSALPGTLIRPSSGNTGNTKSTESTERERAKTAFGEWSFHRVPRRKKKTVIPVLSVFPVRPVPQPILCLCALPHGSAGKFFPTET